MTRKIVAACGIAALTTMTLGAQQSSQPTSRSAQSGSDYGQTVTVTGCLKSWDGSSHTGSTATTPSATSPEATASASAGQFILTNVEPGKSASSSASATGVERSAGAPGKTFVLQASTSGVNLSQHLNHKIEVTGTTIGGHSRTSGQSATDASSSTADRPSSSPGSPASSTAGRDQATAAGSMPTLNVTSVKMVSANCS